MIENERQFGNRDTRAQVEGNRECPHLAVEHQQTETPGRPVGQPASNREDEFQAFWEACGNRSRLGFDKVTVESKAPARPSIKQNMPERQKLTARLRQSVPLSGLTKHLRFEVEEVPQFDLRRDNSSPCLRSMRGAKSLVPTRSRPLR